MEWRKRRIDEERKKGGGVVVENLSWREKTEILMKQKQKD